MVDSTMYAISHTKLWAYPQFPILQHKYSIKNNVFVQSTAGNTKQSALS